MKNEELPLLSFLDSAENNREVFERDLNDKIRPLVDEVRSDLKAEQELMPEYEKAIKTTHHMSSIRRNIAFNLDKLEKELPPYKKPVKLHGIDAPEGK